MVFREEHSKADAKVDYNLKCVFNNGPFQFRSNSSPSGLPPLLNNDTSQHLEAIGSGFILKRSWTLIYVLTSQTQCGVKKSSQTAFGELNFTTATPPK